MTRQIHIAALLLVAGLAQAGDSQLRPLTWQTGAPCFPASGEISIIDLFEDVQSLDRLIGMSPLILEGTVLSVPTMLEKSPGPCEHMLTRPVIHVDEVIKGAVAKGSRRLILWQFGGRINGRELVASGDVLPRPGERYIYFLQSDEPGPDASALPRYIPTRGCAGKVKLKNGKIQFLGCAPALNQYNNAPVIGFTELIKKQINHRATDKLPIQPHVMEQK